MSTASEEERLDEILAAYIEATNPAGDGQIQPADISRIRTRYLRIHPHLQVALQHYFDDEDALRGKVTTAESDNVDFSRYQQLHCIGRGAMGVVYRAFDQQLQRPVALKLTHSDNYHNAQEQAAFRREAQAMARLRHPHIVAVFDTGEHEGRPYLAMDLIDGVSLDGALDQFSGNQHACARLMIDIARAVHHAHQREILHRDLKPANILISGELTATAHAWVCDFGLARPIQHEQADDTTTGVRIEGTACYMSPEQARGEQATTLSDVYGLGAIMYCLLTGEPPYRGSTLTDTLHQVSDPHTKVIAPAALKPGLDPSLEAICLQCLRHEPKQRYASAEGLARDLERWLGHRMTEARPLGSGKRIGLWCRRNPLGAALAAATMTVLMLAAMELYQQLNQPRLAQIALAEQRADTLALRLAQLRQAVAVTAANDQLAALFTARERDGLQAVVDKAGQERVDLSGVSPFESWFAVDMSNGHILARWPSIPTQAIALDLRARDYLSTLSEPSSSGQVKLSRVFSSMLDGLYKFGISTAVTDEQGKAIGAIVATVTTSAQMSFGLSTAHNKPGIVTALLAQRETANALDRSSHPPGASDYLVLLHPAYQRRSKPVWLPAQRLPALAAGQDNHYRDPVSTLNSAAQRQYGGRWSAAFAPVQDSAFIVIVQLRQQPLFTANIWQMMALLAVLLCTVALLLRRFRPKRTASAPELPGPSNR